MMGNYCRIAVHASPTT